MKWFLLIVGLIALLVLTSCPGSRKSGELRLKHVVTVKTSEGVRTFSSVNSMIGEQRYGYGSGTITGGAYGGISSRLTGHAVRMPIGSFDFYFRLPSNPGWNQAELLKKHFGFPNYTEDRSWITLWEALAESDAAVILATADYPELVVMPRGGWMNDARPIDLEEAGKLGLRVVQYRLLISKDAVEADPPFEVRYRPTEEKYPKIEVFPEAFAVKDS